MASDNHRGIRIKPGLYQRKDGVLTLCLLSLLRTPEYKSKPVEALAQLWRWAKEALAKGYTFTGMGEPFHLEFDPPKKAGAK